jgi:hypothetical protein
MSKLELCKIAIDRGFKYDKETGKVIGVRGKEIKRKSYGYIDIAIIVDGVNKHLPAHQFAFYYTHGYIPELIDHIDRDRSNNRIQNLRAYDKNMNNKNTLGKGYYLHNQTGKYCAQITLDYKHIHLGCYETEQEARQAYLIAKNKYHF